MTPVDQFLDVGIRIHLRTWPSKQKLAHKQAFLLVHGLASNARTWDQVARLLSEAGHSVAAIDQRGHGLSDKPNDGYDFETVTRDIFNVLENLGWEQPILAGQSWGGNVLLEFGARFPETAHSLIFVDGGFLSLQGRGSWEQVSQDLRPPNLLGMPRTQIAERIREMHPGWSDEGIEATLGNFETLPDGTIRPWLSLERHMKILKAMYDEDPRSLYPQIQEPVLICAADDGSAMMSQKRLLVETALKGLKQAEAVWFPHSAHDIHVDQPAELVSAFLNFI